MELKDLKALNTWGKDVISCNRVRKIVKQALSEANAYRNEIAEGDRPHEDKLDDIEADVRLLESILGM